MNVYVFGNQNIAIDSLPLKILPKLKKRFPEIIFEVKDPNEEWNTPEELTIIDTVSGIDDVRVFEDITEFADSPKMSLHDFDVSFYIKFLKKLGKIKKIKIIGVPPMMDEEKAVDKISEILKPN